MGSNGEDKLMQKRIVEDDSSEMRSNEGKAVKEKRKRTMKTPDQVQALENFYNEHKYPSEAMKSQLAEATGLTEKQISCWFCHRRLKDKKLPNGEQDAPRKQDKLTVTVLDHANAHREDSCGSTKLGGDWYLDAREVESDSERLIPKGVSSSDVAYQHAVARYALPTLSSQIPVLKPRSGPSGYLKVKGQSENASVTLVKTQLGRQYREDGPRLTVEFDSLPPEAFGSLMEEPVQDTRGTTGTILAAAADATNPGQNTNIYRGCEHSFCTSFCHLKNADRTSFRKSKGCATSGSKLPMPSLSNAIVQDNSSVPLLIAGSHGPAEYVTRRRQGTEIGSVSVHQRGGQDDNTYPNREDGISLEQYLQRRSMAKQLVPNYQLMRPVAMVLPSSSSSSSTGDDDSSETN